MDISALLHTMLLLLSTMAIGYLAVKLRIVDQTFTQGLSRLILYVLQVAMIFSSVLRVQHLLSNRQVLVLTLLAAACYVVIIPLAGLVTRLLRVPDAKRGIYRFLLVFANMGYIGYPVVESLLGPDARFYVTIFILMFQLISFTYGVYLISGDRKHIRLSMDMLKKPVIVASVLAYLFYLTGLSAPQLVADVVGYIGALTTPTSMIVTGCALATVPLSKALGNWRLYAIFAVKMVLVPLLGYVVLSPFVQSETVLIVVVAMLAMPCSTNSTMLSVEYGGDSGLASSGIFLSTVLSIATIPTIMWLLFVR